MPDDRDQPADGRSVSSAESSTGTVELHSADGAAVLRVTGSLDLALAPKLDQQIERAARLGPALIVVDLSELDFLASAGMAALLRAHRRSPASRPLRLVVDRRIILRPLEITRLSDELRVYSTLSEALTGE